MKPILPNCLDVCNAETSLSCSVLPDQIWGMFYDDNGRIIAQCVTKVTESWNEKDDFGERDSNSVDEKFGDDESKSNVDESSAMTENRPEMVLLISTDAEDTIPSSPEVSQTLDGMFSSDLETNYCRTRTWVEKQEDIVDSILSQQNLDYGFGDDNCHSYADDQHDKSSTSKFDEFPTIKDEWYIRKPPKKDILVDDMTIVNTHLLSADVRKFLKHHLISLSTFAKQHLNRTQGTLSDLLNHPKQWDELSTKGKEIYISLMKFLSSPNLQSLVRNMKRKHICSTNKRLPASIIGLLSAGTMPPDDVLTSVSNQLHINSSYLHYHCLEQIKMYNSMEMKVNERTTSAASEIIKKTLKSTPDKVNPKFLDQHICTHFGCGAILQNRPSLRNHLMCHAGIRQHLCMICNEKFSSKYNLNAHLKTHSNSRKFVKQNDIPAAIKTQNSRYVCGICWSGCKSRHCLIKHLSRHGIEKQNIKIGLTCYVCAKTFKTLYALKTHMRIHTNTRPFQCEQCYVGFQTKANLQRHIRKHTGEKPFACPICPAKFSEAKCVTIHMRTHTGERPFKCPICDKGFSQRSPLQAHMLIHKNKKPHLCDLCGKSFRQKGNLRMHIQRHKGIKNHKCQMCDLSFLTKSDFDRHYLKHSGTKLYHCEHCSKGFTRATYLQDHRKKLQAPSAPQCQLCNKKFCDENSMKKHIKVDHDFVQNETVKIQSIDQQEKFSLGATTNGGPLFLASKAMFNDEKHYILTAVRPMENQGTLGKGMINNFGTDVSSSSENLQSFMLAPADDLSSEFSSSEQSILLRAVDSCGQDFPLHGNKFLTDHILISDGSMLSNRRQSQGTISLPSDDGDNIKNQQSMVENSDPNMQSVVVESIEDNNLIILQTDIHETDITKHVKLNDSIDPCQVTATPVKSNNGIVITGVAGNMEISHEASSSTNVNPNANVTNEYVLLGHSVENNDPSNGISKNQTYIIVDLEL